MIHKNLCALVFITGAFFFISGATVYAGPVLLDENLTRINLSRHLEFFEDRGGKLTVEEVSSPDISGDFFTTDSQYPAFGYTDSAYWVRFRVTNTLSREYPWYLEFTYPSIDEVYLRVLDARGNVVLQKKGGDNFAFSERDLDYRKTVFSITEPADSTRWYYIQVKSTSSMNLFMYMWSPDELISAINFEQLALGVYYGAIIVMLLYNLFLFFSLRDNSFFYYVLFYLAFFFFQFSYNGLSFQYLWPNNPWWGNYSIPLFIFICIIFLIVFSISFLELKTYMPRTKNFLWVYMAVAAASIPSVFLGRYYFVIHYSILLTVVAIIVLFVISVVMLVKGYRPARFYIIAWSAFWVGSIMLALHYFNLIPVSGIILWGQQIASFMVLFLLALALADRINYMKNELEDLNINLENMVEDRTRELNDALITMEKKDRDIQIEFELAGNIQQGILPSTPFYYEGIKVEAFYQSMGKVGGDFYDIFSMKGGYLGVLIADASGHGMPAAFITALAKISFDEAIQRSLFPSDIFKQVNNELIETIKTDDFVTAFFIVISPTYEVFYSNASHQRALVLRKQDHRIDEWDTNGLFMGSMSMANGMYEDGQDQLSYGDRVLLYTDGITESKNIHDRKFGEVRLKELFLETASLSLAEAKDEIESAWKSFTREAEQVDDIAVVIVEIDPAYSMLIEYRDRGFSLLWQRKYAEAIAELTRALAINEKDERSHLYIGECYLKNGDYLKSIHHLKRFLVNNEVDANVWYHLALAHFNLGEFDSANNTARRASQLRNDFVDALVICGLSLKRLERSEEAGKIWRRVLEIDSNNEIARLELEQDGR